MAYRASIGGAFGGGAGPATAHPIDVGQILDAFTNGASTLIGNAYARKRAQAELDLNKQKADQEAQRYADQNRINEQRYTDQNTRETTRYEADRKQKKLEVGLKALGEGVKLPSGFWDGFDSSEIPSAPVATTATAQPAISPGQSIAHAFTNADLSVGNQTSQSAAPAAPTPTPSIARSFQSTGSVPQVPTYDASSDPRITRATALEEAKQKIKLSMAPQFASADSTKAVNTARGLVPIHIGQAVATKAAELPMEIQADSIKEAHKPLNPDEGTATVQLPRMVEALNNINKLPPPSARAALTAHGGFWRNYLNSPEGQQFNQAATQAALAGALATEGPRGAQPDRVEYFKKSYVPQAGDSDQVAEQKLTAFRELARGVKIKSGRGYERIDPQTRSVIDGAIAGHGGAAPAGGATAANPFADLIPKKP